MRNIHAIMMDIITPISDLLVQLPVTANPNLTNKSLPTSAKNAGPCFNFYPPPTSDGTVQPAMDPESLFAAIKEELEKAMKTPRGKEDGKKAKVGAILFATKNCAPSSGGSVQVQADVMEVDG